MNDTSQGSLNLWVLGEPKISYQDECLSKGLAGKEQALLIYLACNVDQRFSRDHLATLLWGETSQDHSRYNLRRALWHLREALSSLELAPDECLATEDLRVWVPSTAPCWVDSREFETVIRGTFHHLPTEFSPASQGVRRLREIIELYRGPFLAGFSLSQAPGFEEWVLLERERLFQLLLRAHSGLIQSFIAWGERDQAIGVCRRLLAVDPLQEDTHRLLMRLYWDTGRRSQALRQYHACREFLSQQLGVEPVAETRDLYERILDTGTSPRSVSSLTLTSRVVIPTPAPETVSRPRLFNVLDRGFGVPLTLVSAPPGYGKTTLLAQWIRSRRKQASQDGSLFAWYRLSEVDENPLTFVEGLSTGLSRHHPALGDALREIYALPNPQLDPQHAAGLLIDGLTSLEGVELAVVLDDVELLTGSQSMDLLRFVVQHLPRHVHLYLLTRIDPGLPLARMRVRGHLVEIRGSELRMTEEETEEFLADTGGPRLNPREIADLEALAQGWAAPLWLAFNARSRFAVHLEAVWEAVFAYLRQEVLNVQPVEVGDFLLRTAVLNQLVPAVCQAVISGTKRGEQAAAWLAELRRRNLFLQQAKQRGPEGQIHYAYHPLFLRFLRAELPHHFSAAEIEALHVQAARAWQEHGNHDQWLFHMKKVNDQTAASLCAPSP